MSANPHPLVEILWDDAHTLCSGAWMDLEEAQKATSSPSLCTTVGYVIVDSDKVLTVAGTISTENGQLSSVNGVMSIPRKMVRKVRRLK